MDSPTIILESLINEILSSTGIGINTIKLLTPPCKDNNFLIKEGCNIQGIIYPEDKPSTLYNFVIHVDDENNAESIAILPYG